mmetsp:Transcript_8932/g.27956  ORF Transcript_8932/g.27956 Transcript_8932/m.27956 type:complete len:326 (-) Transcript_8932:246-1223(-)
MAASSLARRGRFTPRSLQSLRTPQRKCRSTRTFSLCLLIFRLESSTCSFRRCSSARLAFRSASSSSLRLLSSCSRSLPALQRASKSSSFEPRSLCRCCASPMSRLSLSTSCRKASSREALKRCSRSRSSLMSVRMRSSRRSISCRSFSFSRRSLRSISRTSLTPSSWFSGSKYCLPKLRSSFSSPSFPCSSSSSLLADASILDLTSSARPARSLTSLCSAFFEASSARRRSVRASCCSPASRARSRSSDSRWRLRTVSSRSRARSFSTCASLSSCSLISRNCSPPPNSTRPNDARDCTLMFPFGAITSPSSVTTCGRRPDLRASW